MFDTIHLDPPLVCPACGNAVASVQTKDFGSFMEDYHIGSVVSMTPVLTGVIKDSLYCDKCPRESRTPGKEAPLFIGIWHSVLVAVDLDLAVVERRLASVDRLDLIGWLAQAQSKQRAWQSRFRSLRNDVFLWREHLQTPPEEVGSDENSGSKAFRRFWQLPDEILNSPDPLGAILDRHPEGESAEGD